MQNCKRSKTVPLKSHFITVITVSHHVIFVFIIIITAIQLTNKISSVIYTTFTWLQDKVFFFFFEICGLSMSGYLIFTYEMPNHTAPNWTALNWTMWSQTTACITKSSYVNRRENREWLKFTGTIFFLGLCPLSNFLKKHNVSEAGSMSNFRQRST